MPHLKHDRSEDNKSSRKVRAEFTKHLLDCSNAEMRVMYDVCYISGSIGIIKGGPADPRRFAEKIADDIKSKRIVKEVIFYNSWRT